MAWYQSWPGRGRGHWRGRHGRRWHGGKHGRGRGHYCRHRCGRSSWRPLRRGRGGRRSHGGGLGRGLGRGGREVGLAQTLDQADELPPLGAQLLVLLEEMLLVQPGEGEGEG